MELIGMRFLGVYMFVLIGVLVGIGTTRLFKNPLRTVPNVLIGIAGSFFGLWLRDVADWSMGGNMRGALLAATIGAVVSTVLVNLALNRSQS